MNANATISKILMVNTLFADKFLCELVKEYVFEDALVAKTRNHMKNVICKLFLEPAVSRKTRSNVCEYWVFMCSYELNERLMLFAMNCRFCGNYIHSNTLDVSRKAMCNCDRIGNEAEDIRMGRQTIYEIVEDDPNDDAWLNEIRNNVNWEEEPENNENRVNRVLFGGTMEEDMLNEDIEMFNDLYPNVSLRQRIRNDMRNVYEEYVWNRDTMEDEQDPNQRFLEEIDEEERYQQFRDEMIDQMLEERRW